jgi:hypothetical protein
MRNVPIAANLIDLPRPPTKVANVRVAEDTMTTMTPPNHPLPQHRAGNPAVDTVVVHTPSRSHSHDANLPAATVIQILAPMTTAHPVVTVANITTVPLTNMTTQKLTMNIPPVELVPSETLTPIILPAPTVPHVAVIMKTLRIPPLTSPRPHVVVTIVGASMMTVTVLIVRVVQLVDLRSRIMSGVIARMEGIRGGRGVIGLQGVGGIWMMRVMMGMVMGRHGSGIPGMEVEGRRRWFQI